MRKNTDIFLLIGILFLLLACSDDESFEPFQGVIDWEVTFGGSGEDIARAILLTEDNNIALLGTTNSIDGNISDKSLAENDYWLLKTDLSGNLLWNKTIGGSGDDRGRALVQTADNGFALAGYSRSADGDASNNEGQHDNWIVKTNASGDVEWEKSSGFSGHDHAYGLVNTDDGGFFMGGFLDVSASMGEGNDLVAGHGGNTTSASFNNNSRHGIGEFWCHRLDASGNKIWRRYFGGTNNDRVHSVVKGNDGGFVMAGFSESNDFDIESAYGSYDFWVVKIDDAGNKVWAKNFGGDAIDIAYASIATGDGYLIAGSSNSVNNGDVLGHKGSTDAWVVKIDNNGQLVWAKAYGGSDFDAFYAVTAGPDQTFYLAGTTRSIDVDVAKNQGQNDLWIAQIHTNGALQWQGTFGGSELEYAYGIAYKNNRILVAGQTASSDGDIGANKGMNDLWLVSIK